jgi:hypothetical protein
MVDFIKSVNKSAGYTNENYIMLYNKYIQISILVMVTVLDCSLQFPSLSHPCPIYLAAFIPAIRVNNRQRPLHYPLISDKLFTSTYLTMVVLLCQPEKLRIQLNGGSFMKLR